MATPWFMYHVNKGYGDYGGRFHDGWDFGAPSHTPLISLTGGKVTKHTGWYPWGGEVDIKGGALGPGITETFAHADRIDVKPGDVVWPGSQVGLSGGEGLPPQYSTGPHVHYSLFGGAPWDNTKSINPGGWLNSIRKYGVGNESDASGGIPGVQAIADAIDNAYKGAETAISKTVKRAGWFILGLGLIVLGAVLLMLAVAGKAEQKIRPYAQAAARVV